MSAVDFFELKRAQGHFNRRIRHRLINTYFVGCLGIIWIFVGVKLEGEFSVCLLDLFGCCGLG